MWTLCLIFHLRQRWSRNILSLVRPIKGRFDEYPTGVWKHNYDQWRWCPPICFLQVFSLLKSVACYYHGGLCADRLVFDSFLQLWLSLCSLAILLVQFVYNYVTPGGFSPKLEFGCFLFFRHGIIHRMHFTCFQTNSNLKPILEIQNCTFDFKTNLVSIKIDLEIIIAWLNNS